MKASDFVYLPQAARKSRWGIELLGAGMTKVAPHQSYPLPGHPEDYQFNWERGRRLATFQALYITDGSGEFESEDCSRRTLKAPCLFILFPDNWHRYRPHAEHGWKELWVGFDGPMARQLTAQGSLSPRRPFFEVGRHSGVFEQFQLALEEARDEARGYRDIAATAVLQILALAMSLPSRRVEENQPMRSIVREACFILRDRTDQTLSVEDLAKQLNVGYTYFRRLFKRYTGLSPKQYHTQLRYERAKRLLRETPMTVSEIAALLSFDSAFHLSAWFKRHAGVAPSIWRGKLP